MRLSHRSKISLSIGSANTFSLPPPDHSESQLLIRRNFLFTPISLYFGPTRTFSFKPEVSLHFPLTLTLLLLPSPPNAVSFQIILCLAFSQKIYSFANKKEKEKKKKTEGNTGLPARRFFSCNSLSPHQFLLLSLLQGMSLMPLLILKGDPGQIPCRFLTRKKRSLKTLPGEKSWRGKGDLVFFSAAEVLYG